MTTILGPPATLLSMDDIGNDLLTTLLTSLSLESCIPIFNQQSIDVFRWLGMKHAEDFANIGVDSAGACQTLSLFTHALGRHLNGLPPCFDQLQNQSIYGGDQDRLEQTVNRAVALFDQYTQVPTRQQSRNKSIGWSSTLTSTPSSSRTQQQRSEEGDDIPPPYRTPKKNKADGLIKRLSLKQHRPPRPISMPVITIPQHESDDHTPQTNEHHTNNDTSSPISTLARRFSLHRYSSTPPPITNPARQLLQEQKLLQRQHQVQQHLLLQQQQQIRDHYLRQRWEKCRSHVILPREEEGREELPGYRCTVYKMGHVWVKREMDGPVTKSRYRTWCKMYLELWGTVLRFYPVKTRRRFTFYYSGHSDDDDDDDDKNNNNKTTTTCRNLKPRPTVATNESSLEDPLTPFYLNPPPSGSSSSTDSISSSDSDGSSPIAIATHATFNFIRRSYRYSQQYATPTIKSTSSRPSQQQPLDTISLARAEAARAYDYIKRPHVLRLVIDQGPHLLLRLANHPAMISWIEHLQAAINISLDLELRPMPKFMTLPSRLSSTDSNDSRALYLERAREQRYRDQCEMLI